MYIYPYKKEWKSEYENEYVTIISAYESDIKLYHIGSTAIEGMHAKDCIDILGVVDSLLKVRERTKNLERIGYKYKGNFGIPGREYFSKKERKVHLHIFEMGDLNIKRYLDFVEIMRGNSKLISELNEIKINLQNKYPSDKDKYQKGKIYFYESLRKMR